MWVTCILPSAGSQCPAPARRRRQSRVRGDIMPFEGKQAADAVGRVSTSVGGLLATYHRPVLVAVDGASGAGKSTLAPRLAQELAAVIVPLDDFFSGQIPDLAWDQMSAGQRLRHVFDWERLRQQALLPLLSRRPANWWTYDFTAGLQTDGTYPLGGEPKGCQPANVILLEGAYAASAPLHDLVDLALLVDVPVAVRHQRLADREPPDLLARWHALWDPVEQLYFEELRPKASFDLVVTV